MEQQAEQPQQQQQQQQQQHGGPPDVPHLRGSKQGPPHMHAKLLSLHPQHFEQVYFEQLEALDLVNCIICPLFFANALLIWTRSLLNAVYCLVLLVKGYQLGLLLLPAARRQRAYRRSRYYLILAERVLRQWVATPALGHGPRFIPWLRQLQTTTSPALLVVKLLVLISGVTISFWNAFCLPLDFVSQAVLNTLFLCIHFPPNVTQVAYGVAVLVRSHRHLGWAQWALEEGARRLLPAALVAAAAAGNSSLSSSSGASASTSAGAAAMCLIRSAAANFTAAAGSSTGSSGSSCAAPQGALLSAASSAAAAVYAPARRAPDLDSVAGRLVLALSTAWMLFAVLIVPLYLAWRMERHLKSKFVATVTLAASPPGGGASSTLLPHQQQQQQQQPLPPPSKACMPTSGGDGGGGAGAGPLGVHPFIPSVWQLLHDLGAAAAASLAVGEAFVGLCVLSPRVAGMLWQQVLDVDV